MSQQRFLLGGTQELGDNEIGVIAASSDLARDGHVLVVAGLSLENYRKNPIVLWDHNPDQPIGACTAVGMVGDKLAARIELSDASPKAQEIRAFAKGGIVKGVSIGFDPIDAEPLDPAYGSRGGMRITSSELLDISLVSVPSDVNGMIIARGYKSYPGASAVLRAAPRNSTAAIARALSGEGLSEIRRKYEEMRRRNGGYEPQERPTGGLLQPWELVEQERQRRAQHCRTVGALQMVERERDSSLEQRRADLLQLTAIGRGH
jgi:HK97 family phage prohead protease